MGETTGSRQATNDLLLPGPQPPLTHFGATLLRHVVVTGLRYTLYHLGLAVPDKPPIRIHQLQLYLDSSAVERMLDGQPAGPAVAAALVDPLGVAPAREVGPTGAAFFHRLRLRRARHRRLPRPEQLPTSSTSALEYHFRCHLSACLPALNNALLDEVLTVLERRRHRRRGTVEPALGAAAAAWAAGRRTRLERLGPPDPFTPSWLAEVPAIDREGLSHPAKRDAGRGRFREVYREVLDGLRSTLTAMGEAAHADGVIDQREDLFFLPFELLGDLAGSDKPPWLDAAVLRNRAEYFGLVRAADGPTEAAWSASPLNLMP
ncbi:MAG: hypothetical protein O7A98_06315 [Acidobacteria bacterium]|nr:hypothetical protein [Acidobacteriota bacterium]